MDSFTLICVLIFLLWVASLVHLKLLYSLSREVDAAKDKIIQLYKKNYDTNKIAVDNKDEIRKLKIAYERKDSTD